MNETQAFSGVGLPAVRERWCIGRVMLPWTGGKPKSMGRRFDVVRSGSISHGSHLYSVWTNPGNRLEYRPFGLPCPGQFVSGWPPLHNQRGSSHV